MSHDVLSQVHKKTARRLLATEAKRRRLGEWGAWEKVENPMFGLSTGWLGQVRIAHRNKVFSVLDRDVGTARHLAISSLSERRPTWYEMQRIKDELAGPGATGVEVYPPADELIDGANMYHLWVLPGPLPFSLTH